MISDAIKGTQLIGMDQTKDELTPATLHSVGGRLESVLEGICRVDIDEELNSIRGYRLIKPRWRDYQYYFSENPQADAQHSLLYAAI